MRLPFRFWKSFFSSLGQLRQARRRAKDARNKRRSLRRCHELSVLEPRVVMNADPIAVDDEFSTTMDQAIAFTEDDLKANDSDPEGDTLSVVGIHGRPQHGSITWNYDGSLTYNPDAGFSGTDSFDYVLSDGNNNEVRGTINIQVDAPPPPNNDFELMAATGSATINAEGSYTFNPMENIASDPDGDVMFEIAEPAFGSIIDNGDGTFTFQPGPTIGTIDLVVHYFDDEFSRDYTIGLTIEPALNRDFSLWESETAVDLETSDTWHFSAMNAIAEDLDGNVTYHLIGTPSFGTFSDEDGTLSFTPWGAVGTTLIVVRFTDGEFVHDWTVNFSVYEEEVVELTLYSYAHEDVVDIEGGWNFWPLNNVETSPSGSPNYTIEGPTFGTIYDHGDNFYTFYPGIQTGTATIIVRYEDGGSTAEQIITITVTTPNSAPQATADEYVIYIPQGYADTIVDLSEYPPTLTNDSDPDGDEVTLVGVSYDPGYPQVLIGVNESFSYDYTIDDGHGGTATGTVTIYVYAEVNHSPSAVNDEYFVTLEHGAPGVTVDLADYPPDVANDIDGDGDLLTVVNSYDPANRYVWIAAGSSHVYVYTVDDGFGGTSVGQVAIHVTAPNANPQAVNDSYAAVRNEALSVDVLNGLLVNDTDADYDELYVVPAFEQRTTQEGWVTIAADGSFSYVSAIDFVGTDTFTYHIVDEFGGTSTATATIVVAAPLSVNQAPTFTAGSNISVHTDAVQTVIAGWAYDVSPGAAEDAWQSLHFTIAVDHPELFDVGGLPQLVLNTTTGNYDLVFKHVPGAHGAATLTVVLHDDGGTDNGGVDASEPVTFVIAISPFGGHATTGGAVPVNHSTPARVGMTELNRDAKEGDDETLQFTVMLAQPATEEIEVDWIARSGTAYADVDFIAARGTLTFAVGETSKTIEITLIDDGLDRGDDRTFQVVLTGAIGAEVVEEYEATTVTLEENDATVSISAETGDGIEGVDYNGTPNTVRFIIELSRELDEAVTVEYTISGEGAGDVADQGGGSVTFEAGERWKTIVLDIVNDDNWTPDPNDENLRRGEPTKSVIVTISTADECAMIETASATAVIVDDDWQEYGPTGAQIPIETEFRPEDYLADDVIDLDDDLAHLNGGLTEFIVPENWQGQSFWVWGPEYQWQQIEPRESLPGVSVTWVDSEPVTEEQGAKVRFRIQVVGIDYGSGTPVTVTYTTRGITAVAGDDFTELTGSITFTEDGYHDVEIDLTADELAEPLETLALAITDVSGGIVSGVATALAQVKADARVTKVTFAQTGSTGELRFDRGTYRFFPDAKYVGGQLQSGPSNTVRVRAEVEGLKAGDLVYFAAFDVDDPTYFGSQWDNDIGIAGRRGNDNLGKIDLNNPYAPIDVETSTTIGFSGLLRDADAPNNAPWVAPAAGRNFPITSAVVYFDAVANVYYAEVDLLTSFQPGDNFRVVALPQRQADNNPGNIPTYVEDAFHALDFADESINAQPAAESGMSASRVLTVWRKLHVELDVMQSAAGQAGDQVSAQASAVIGAVVTLNNVVGTVTTGSLVGGVLQIGVGQNATYYAITANSAIDVNAGTMTVTVNLNSAQGADAGAFAALAAGDAVLLHDDDKRVASVAGEYSIVPKIDPASDEVRDAVQAFLQGGVNQQSNRFAGAFVEADFTTLASLQSAIPFEAHSTPVDSDNPTFGGQSYRGSAALENDPRFWVSYLAVAYQSGDPGPSPDYGSGIPDRDWDAAPGVEALTGGETPAVAVEWSVIYVENLRDIWQDIANAGSIGGGAYVPRTLLEQIAFVAAHELGVQLDVSAMEANPTATPWGINDDTPNLMSSRQLVYTNALSALKLLPQDAIFLRRNFKAGPRRN